MNNTPILIFADDQTERLNYVLDFLFKDKGQPYALVTDQQALSGEVHISYSKETIQSKIQINPSGLLKEREISSDWVVYFDKKNDRWLINQEKDDFAIIFYFLTRYEEYTDAKRDQMGRFTAKQSLLYEFNQLHIPWCDVMVKTIWNLLSLNFDSITRQSKTILTYDIDVAWAYKYKPFWRNIANMAKNIFRPKQLIERLNVLYGKLNDPYDHYDLIKANAKTHPTLVFFLLGNYGKYDKNHHWKNKKLQGLIKDLDRHAEIGIHPSFHSFLDLDIILKEKKRLEAICQHSIKKSRQHFLRMTLPDSYQVLEKGNISHDFTMGYAEHYGFRAGTSFPFTFFNLLNNSKGSLQITPFTFMDGTLKDYMKLNPKEAIEVIEVLKDNVKNVGGQFIPLWHNHSIGDTKEWRGWQKVYESCLS